MSYSKTTRQARCKKCHALPGQPCICLETGKPYATWMHATRVLETK